MDDFQKYGLKGKDKILVELLEQILEELQEINKSLKGARPSPS